MFVCGVVLVAPFFVLSYCVGALSVVARACDSARRSPVLIETLARARRRGWRSSLGRRDVRGVDRQRRAVALGVPAIPRRRRGVRLHLSLRGDTAVFQCAVFAFALSLRLQTDALLARALPLRLALPLSSSPSLPKSL